MRRHLAAMFSVSATYVYFLIYAQFAFLAQIQQKTGSDPTPALACMGGCGLLASLWTSRWLKNVPSQFLLFSGFLGCALAALLSLFTAKLYGFTIVAGLLGAALGTVTVTLASSLRAWIKGAHFARTIGLGTGLGYLVCNLPIVFTAAPSSQALIAAVFALFGCAVQALIPKADPQEASPPQPKEPGLNLWRGKGFMWVLAVFLALIWLDSALFFIIQQNEPFKQETWTGTRRLWVNGGFHLAAAFLAGWALDRGLLRLVLPFAFIFLAGGSVVLAMPDWQFLAAPLYVSGVSFYSTALVAFPGMAPDGGNLLPIRIRAALIYGVAGWVGSAMGIGMAKDLHHIPLLFLLIAGMIILSFLPFHAMGKLGRLVHLPGMGLLMAALLIPTDTHPLRAPHDPNNHTRLMETDTGSAIQRGREVYMAEGCIHCHSQYVRPGTPDELMWGPAQPVEEVTRMTPPLIGNRRQGPDLAMVGNRRHPIWQRLHLVDPRTLSPYSVMPSYAHLFKSRKGEDLIAYLQSLGATSMSQRLDTVLAWQPDPSSRPLSLKESAALFASDCAPCHGDRGFGDGPLADAFPIRPRNLALGSFHFLDEWDEHFDGKLARLIKFGQPGTPMPGHETYSDNAVLGMVQFIKAIHLKHP